jgi:subtilisin family serine protease
MLVLGVPRAKRRLRGGTISQEALLTKATVRVEDMDDQDISEARGDPSKIVAEGSMPVICMSPVQDESGLGGGPAADGSAWGVRAVEADACKETGAGVAVAILDSGVDIGHPAFSGLAFAPEDLRDFTGVDPSPGNVSAVVQDEMGHGTHCAATAVGRDFAGRRIGVARGVDRLIVGRIFRPGMSFDARRLHAALNWAINERRAQVVSLSLSFDLGAYADALIKAGWPVASATARAADEYVEIVRFWDLYFEKLDAEAAANELSGALVVAAAGNQSRRGSGSTSAGEILINTAFPARARNVVSVGALGHGPGGLSVASFSNGQPTVAAPGVEILSAAPSVGSTGSLAQLSGTSMACPHVAGLATLWWAQERSREGRATTASRVRERLKGSVSFDGIDKRMRARDVGLGMPRAPR